MQCVVTVACDFWNVFKVPAITIFDQMDWSIRGPWFARGAIVYMMSDLFDTPNGMPPESTVEDFAESSEHGFHYDVWLEYHPLPNVCGQTLICGC